MKYSAHILKLERELWKSAREPDIDEKSKKLNMKPLMPSWMRAALSANWTPPQGFDPNFYTKE